jgi:hypothetical protein
MANPSFNIPSTPITADQPRDRVSEAEKFENDGYWFLRYARWICYRFYNPIGQQFYNGEVTSGWADDCLTNFAYYFGRQNNLTFSFQKELPSGGTIPTVYIPDQKIRTIIENMIGTCEKMVKPIKKSLSATAISYDSLKLKNALRDQLMKQVELQGQIQELANTFGVEYAPNGVPAGVLKSEQDVDTYIGKIKEKIELQLVKVAQSIYYENRMDRQFIDDALQTFVGNLCTTMFDVVGDRVVATTFPCYNSIFDFRAKDEQGKDAMLGGGVVPMTPTQIFTAFPNLSEDTKAEIEQMCSHGYDNWKDVSAYYNAGQTNMTWWPELPGTTLVGFVRWIGPKDLRYKKRMTAYGGTKIKFLDDNKDYQVPGFDEGGNVAYKNVKGKDIPGDGKALFEHCAVIAGNKWLLHHGYTPFQIRSIFNMNRPELSVKSYCYRLTMGYARSIASRLRQMADEKGRLREKIQQLTAADKGKNFVIFADQLEGTSAAEVYEDFSTMNITVINRKNGQPINDGKYSNMGEVVDLSLSPTVQLYRQLILDCDAEMESIANVPAVSLGLQNGPIGKGVQQNTLQQATLGQLSLYEGLNEHWRIKLQYAANLYKNANAGKEMVIRMGPSDTDVINLPKYVRYQDVGVFIEANDDVEGNNKQMFDDALFNYGQNPTDEGAEALLNIMRLMRPGTYNEKIDLLQEYVERKKALTQQQQAASQESEQKWQAEMQSRAEDNAIGIAQMKEQHADYRAEIAALNKSINELMKIIANPVVAPIEQREAAESQAEAQAQQQQQAPQAEMQS